MIKNILIFSDNAYLCKKIFEIIERKKISDCFFSFSISPFSKKEDFKISDSIDIQVLDVKNQLDIDFIVNNYELVFSIHCKQFFPAGLINRIKCINLHPGYNPFNRGWYPQVFSIINRLPAGATIHEMDDKLDHGDIIAREFVHKNSFDTSETLYKRIVEKEIELVDRNLENIIKNEYKVIKQEDDGNLYLKKDFDKLLELDLTEQVSIGDFIDRLRALTHGNFNNAYFFDNNGDKIHVSINLKKAGD